MYMYDQYRKKIWILLAHCFTLQDQWTGGTACKEEWGSCFAGGTEERARGEDQTAGGFQGTSGTGTASSAKGESLGYWPGVSMCSLVCLDEAVSHCTAAHPAHDARHPTLLLTGSIVCGVCALESSSYTIDNYCAWQLCLPRGINFKTKA